MKLHHAALCVSDIRQAVDWYVQNLNANIAYQDETWALLDIENTSIALVLPSQHPPHLAFETQDAKKYGKLTPHRDGTASVYVKDPFGNTVEFLKTVAS
ncbi:MAG: VOC family protein [Alphaproteobacteria bacterium]|jgi:catechol 2,3-dioxygenase-like lactoylglutathione lyase family enzyme